MATATATRAAPRPRCRAHTRDGKQCQNPAKAGSDFCGAHSGETGRKLKLTPERENQMFELASLGTPLGIAASACGLGVSTLHRYRNEGEKELRLGLDSQLANFFARLEQERAKGYVRLLLIARKQAESGDGGLAFRMLAKQWPEQNVERTSVEHSGAVVTAIACTPEHRVELQRLTPAQRERLIELQREMEELTDVVA